MRNNRILTRASATLIATTVAVIGPLVASGHAVADPNGSSDLDPGSLEGLNLDDLNIGDWDFGSLGGSGKPPSVQRCNQKTTSGGQGVTETKYLLGGRGPTSFTLRYETLKQPDEIRVFYQGRLIHNTGYVGDNKNEGTGSARVTVPVGFQDFVTVRVTGPESGTKWSYTGYCPS